MASRAPFLANARDWMPGARAIGERVLGFSKDRALPRFARAPFRDTAGEAPAPRGDVLLLADTFNRYFEPENLHAARRVLRAAGYRAVSPRAADSARPLCCGRTYLAAGMVDEARAEARRTMDALSGSDLPVVGLEPSCLLTLRDEFKSLLPGEAADRLADRALLLSEFLMRQKAELPLKHVAPAVHIHGHCHQKAFGAFPEAVKALRAVPGLEVKPITSSCCGMAGAFGYDARRVEASKAMGELSLAPAVRAAPGEDLIVADGTSCRHQIADLTGREALHSVRVLDMAIASGP
jgi:Fe-S oxidoreductase